MAESVISPEKLSRKWCIIIKIWASTLKATTNQYISTKGFYLSNNSSWTRRSFVTNICHVANDTFYNKQLKAIVKCILECFGGNIYAIIIALHYGLITSSCYTHHSKPISRVKYVLQATTHVATSQIWIIFL